MKKFFGLLGLLLFSFNIYSQIQEPVKWSYTIENNGSENPTLVIKASIDDHWHVYSQFVGEGGPLPTTFKFTPNPNYQLIKSTPKYAIFTAILSPFCSTSLSNLFNENSEDTENLEL